MKQQTNNILTNIEQLKTTVEGFRKRREELVNELSTIDEALKTVAGLAPSLRRGRKPGQKNKPKTVAVEQTAQ